MTKHEVTVITLDPEWSSLPTSYFKTSTFRLSANIVSNQSCRTSAKFTIVQWQSNDNQPLLNGNPICCIKKHITTVTKVSQIVLQYPYVNISFGNSICNNWQPYSKVHLLAFWRVQLHLTVIHISDQRLRCWKVGIGPLSWNQVHMQYLSRDNYNASLHYSLYGMLSLTTDRTCTNI